MVPYILKETSNGFSKIQLEDKMLSERKILCIGKITTDTVNDLILQLLYLESEDDQAPITLYINSVGGELISGLALYDVMQAVSCPIHTVCVGMAASMGALLFSSGEKRYMLPHSKVMIHDPLISSIGGSALTVQQTCDNLMNSRKICAEILAKNTGRTLDEIYEKTSSDSYFSAKESIDFGLCDVILQNINEL